MQRNQLHYGDNLVVLREHIKDDSVDLIYLDPPFNSRQNHNVLFAGGHDPQNQSKRVPFWYPITSGESKRHILRRGDGAEWSGVVREPAVKHLVLAAFLLTTLSHAKAQVLAPASLKDQPVQVYFYRENHLIASAGRAEVFMDGKRVCMLRSNHYCAATVPAGQHTIGNNESKFTFEPGQTYYLKITTNKGSLGSWALMPEWKATLEPDGAKKIARMKNND